MAEAPKAEKPTFQMPTDRAPTPEEVTRYIKEHPELQKPLIFPNHQGKFIAFSWLACAGKNSLSAKYYLYYGEQDKAEKERFNLCTFSSIFVCNPSVTNFLRDFVS